MFLGICNRVDGSTLSGGSWIALDKVKNRQLYSVARSNNTTTANTQFQIDLGSVQAINCLSIHAHNLTANATITLRAGTSAGGDDVLSSAGNNAYGVTFDEIREFSSHYAIIIDANVTAQHWTIEISDAANPAGFVELGRVGLWQGLTPNYNMSWGVRYGINDDMSDVSRSIAGDFLYSQKTRKRTARFSLDWLTDIERDQAHELSRIKGRTGELLLHVSDQKYNMLCRLEQPNMLQRKFLNTNSTEFKLVEL